MQTLRGSVAYDPENGQRLALTEARASAGSLEGLCGAAKLPCFAASITFTPCMRIAPMKRLLTVALMGLALGLGLSVACAEDKPEAKKEPEVKKEADGKKEPEAKKDAEAGTVVEISGNDTMKYSTDKIEVVAGKPVKLTLKNAGQVPKIAMGHNFVVLVAGEDAVKFGDTVLKDATSGATPATDYIPTKEDYKKKILAHTKLLGPGESDTIEFTAPAAGEYDFLCLFPGHYMMMKGKLVSK